MRQVDFGLIKEFDVDKKQWENNEELGFDFGSLLKVAAPIAGTVLGGPVGTIVGGIAGDAVGGLLGGKKKNAAPANVPAEQIVSSIPSPQVSNPEIVSLVSSLPQLVREQVKQVILETQANKGTIEQANRTIAATVDAQFQPQIKAILKSLALAQTQREVTSEHNAIMAEKEYKRNTTRALTNLNRQIANMSAQLNSKLSGAKVIRNRKVIDILGGNDFMESLNR